MRKLLVSLSLLGGIAVASAHAGFKHPAPLAAEVMVIKKPQIQVDRPATHSAKAFMMLHNKGHRTEELIAVNSPVATQTLLKRAVYKGVRTVSKIIIYPETHKPLQADNVYIRLNGLQQILHPGDSVPLLLIFADGSSLTVRATVNLPAPAGTR